MLEKVALDKEKESLDEENKRLKMLLKQYLDGNGLVRYSIAIIDLSLRHFC